ncbi:MAG: N-acetylmuramic acid 6-phosphate etherase, partial [Flavobacteriaceae bacterium]
INSKDFIIGIAASGTTPYVIGGLSEAQKNGIPTGCIVSNLNSPVSNVSDFPIEVVVGPEFVTGSSRMKAGTAQKLILNSITTATMIQLGHIRGNKMVDMQLSNDKLTDRAERMVMEATGANLQVVQKTLQTHRNARKAIDELNKKN